MNAGIDALSRAGGAPGVHVDGDEIATAGAILTFNSPIAGERQMMAIARRRGKQERRPTCRPKLATSLMNERGHEDSLIWRCTLPVICKRVSQCEKND